MSAPRPPRLDDVSPADGDVGEATLASGESLDVVGREREMDRLERILGEAAAGRSSVLLVTGDAGVGKSTLLAAVRARASGFSCLAVAGAESEQELAHAGLLGLLSPVRELVDEIPAAQAAALRSAIGWGRRDREADRFLVGAATLSLLAAAAERRPVLVLVDDVQWLDRESLEAIGFAARRLGPDSVAVVLAARPESAGLGPLVGLPMLGLGGLGAAAAAELLPDMARGAVERLVEETQGNPLALLEVSRRLSDEQRSGAASLPPALPVGQRLHEIYAATLAALSDAGRAATLLVALAGASRSSSAVVATALRSRGLDPDPALDAAQRAGLLVRVGGRHVLRHPLLRSVLLETVGGAEQRAAHSALADALPAGDRAQLWHRAEACLGTDADLAEQLAHQADVDRDRSGHAGASLALERASELTPQAELAAERLAAAAHEAFVAGDVARVRDLGQRVLAGNGRERVRGRALFTLGMLEQYAGSVPRSVEYLADAADLLDGVELVRALTELALARFRLNDLAGVAGCGSRVLQVADQDDPEQLLLALFTSGAGAMVTGDVESGTARLAEVRRLSDLPELRHDARALLLMALAAGFTGQVADAVTVGAARLEEVRRRGAIGVLVPALTILSAGRAWLGDHAAAFADAGEAVELAAPLGYAADAAVAVEMVAWQSAARGLHDDALQALARARELTDRAGTTPAAAHQALTAAFCALCRGDLAEVVSLLEHRILADGGVGAMGEPLGVAPLLVEAYVGLGRLDDARVLTTRYRDATVPGSPPLPAALTRRCTAITAPDDEVAARAFAEAEELHAGAGDPFETARTRLLFGSRLRRAGRRVQARGLLMQARDQFESMELTHWSVLASQELSATGTTARRRSTSNDEALTSQETRVALLAAQGLTNKEIAASLFLSHKTVERHLTQVFRKRGFRSRAQLAAAFAARAAEQ